MSRKSAEVPQEAGEFLAANSDVRAVELLLPDLNGILRGKRVSRREVPALYTDGVSFPATGILLDSRGALIEGLVHGNDDGDPDFVCEPVAGTLARVPWSGSPIGQCLISMHEHDGRPYFADSRHVLNKVLSRFGELGLTPVVAVEYEFYLLEDIRGVTPTRRTGRAPGSTRRPAGPRAYSLEDLHDLDGFFAGVAAAAEVQGIPAGAIVSEYGAGQFEVNLHHEGDALVACDHAILLRRLIRGVAREHGMSATFMAKPFTELDGSGMHVHLSLVDRSGYNVLGPAPSAVTPDCYPDTLRHAVGGMLAAMGESRAIFAPNANSYRRFRPGFFVPTAPTWGPNHRQVAVRIPCSDDANMRLEHRIAGADCNPYLAMAAILAAAHAGISRRIEPPPMTREGEPVRVPTGPSPRWETALAEFDASNLWPEYLGTDYCQVFSAARRFEAEAYHAEVPGLDYEWYLACT
ncbi:MAG: glutamine synthetase family protein [Gammaproteobacteria bacterium]